MSSEHHFYQALLLDLTSRENSLKDFCASDQRSTGMRALGFSHGCDYDRDRDRERDRDVRAHHGHGHDRGRTTSRDHERVRACPLNARWTSRSD